MSIHVTRAPAVPLTSYDTKRSSNLKIPFTFNSIPYSPTPTEPWLTISSGNQGESRDVTSELPLEMPSPKACCNPLNVYKHNCVCKALKKVMKGWSDIYLNEVRKFYPNFFESPINKIKFLHIQRVSVCILRGHFE